MLDMRRFEKQWRAKARDDNFSFSLIIADLVRLMQSHVTSLAFWHLTSFAFKDIGFSLVCRSSAMTRKGVWIWCTIWDRDACYQSCQRFRYKSQPPRLKFLKHMPFGAEHHMKWFFWSKTPKRSWFFGAERPIIFSWGRVLFFWESDQVNFCAIPSGIVNPRVECKEWGSRLIPKGFSLMVCVHLRIRRLT